MKKISYWAKHHPWSSRIIIVLSFIFLTALGIFTGDLLNQLGIFFSPVWIVVFTGIYIAGALAYPARSLKGTKLAAAAFYVRQKGCDLLLTASTFCMIVYFSNQPGELFIFSAPLSATAPLSGPVPSDSIAKPYKSIAAFNASMKDKNGHTLKWKERKKLLKEQIRAIKSSDASKGGKTALIILSVLVAAGLILLVLGLACELSCSGSEGAAILVGVGGIGLVIFLLVITIRGINRKQKKQRPVEEISPGQG
jgi:hypothetical protein